MNPRVIRVGRPIANEGDGVTVSTPAAFPVSGYPDTLEFHVRNVPAEHVRLDRTDWLIMGLLMPAMLHGLDIDLQTPISSGLAFALGDLQSILMVQHPRLQRIRIRAPEIEDKAPRGSAVATGFSAGVDSFSTIMEFTGCDRSGDAITHLTTFNVGAMENRASTAELFQTYCRRTEIYAERKGLACLFVDTNLADFYAHAFTFQQTHTLRNAAAAALLAGFIRRYYYSSAVAFGEVRVSETYDIADADPLILALISTPALHFVSAGSTYSRLERVKRVAEFEDSFDMLDVCVDSPDRRIKRDKPNCSVCWKCGRQLFSLELIGRLERYAAVFDLDRYRQYRTFIIGQVYAARHSVNERDIIALAKTSGIRIPISSRIMSWAINRKNSRLLRRLKQPIKMLMRA